MKNRTITISIVWLLVAVCFSKATIALVDSAKATSGGNLAKDARIHSGYNLSFLSIDGDDRRDNQGRDQSDKC